MPILDYLDCCGLFGTNALQNKIKKNIIVRDYSSNSDSDKENPPLTLCSPSKEQAPTTACSSSSVRQRRRILDENTTHNKTSLSS